VDRPQNDSLATTYRITKVFFAGDPQEDVVFASLKG